MVETVGTEAKHAHHPHHVNSFNKQHSRPLSVPKNDKRGAEEQGRCFSEESGGGRKTSVLERKELLVWDVSEFGDGPLVLFAQAIEPWSGRDLIEGETAGPDLERGGFLDALARPLFVGGQFGAAHGTSGLQLLPSGGGLCPMNTTTPPEKKGNAKETKEEKGFAFPQCWLGN